MTQWISKSTEAVALTVLHLAGILLLALLLNRTLRGFTRRLVRLATSKSPSALLREEQTRTLAGIVYSAGTTVIFAAAVLAALPELGINITPFAAVAGLASLALGFGAQNVVRDLINGFFIVFEDQYGVGDTIRLGALTGRVEHLTLRRTVLRDQGGTLWTISNGEIRQAGNLSRDWSQVFVDVNLPSGEGVDRVLAVLELVCSEVRGDAAWVAALVDGPRVLGVESLAAAGTVFRLQVRTPPARQHDVARELRRRIQARFELEGIALAGVQRVELVGAADSALRETPSSQ